MAGFREQMLKLQELRKEAPSAVIIPGLGLPRLMVIGFAVMLFLCVFQWFTRGIGRGAGAVGGGVTSRASSTPAPAAVGSSVSQAGGVDPAYRLFVSPGDNLAGLDQRMLLQATESVDMAMQGEVDDRVCNALGVLAKRGVQVRLLRDAEGFAAEQERAGGSCSSALAQIGISVRVAKEGTLKLHSYSLDGLRLRSGTAGLGEGESRVGEDVELVASAAAVGGFERAFTALWNDPSDKLVRGTAAAQ